MTKVFCSLIFRWFSADQQQLHSRENLCFIILINTWFMLWKFKPPAWSAAASFQGLQLLNCKASLIPLRVWMYVKDGLTPSGSMRTVSAVVVIRPTAPLLQYCSLLPGRLFIDLHGISNSVTPVYWFIHGLGKLYLRILCLLCRLLSRWQQSK